VAVEFLFGPTKSPGPSPADKWRLRGAVIVHQYIQANIDNKDSIAISLEELSPYSDTPPKSLQDTSRILSEGLLVVAHFNGVPSESSASSSPSSPSNSNPTKDIIKARFTFPELIAESHIATRYDEANKCEDDSWEGLFYHKEPSSACNRRTGEIIPSFLQERRYCFTQLEQKQFLYCFSLGVLNFLGVLFFAQALQPGGVLVDPLGSAGTFLNSTLIPLLQFYAKLFFALPAGRLVLLAMWNQLIKRRNQRREKLAAALQSET
jgi:hypothetical protein